MPLHILLSQVTKHKLTTNMRTEHGTARFSEWLLTIGRPQDQQQDEYNLTLPQNMCVKKNECVNFVYGEMDENNAMDYKTNALLTPWNVKADEINNQVWTHLMSSDIIHYSLLQY